MPASYLAAWNGPCASARRSPAPLGRYHARSVDRASLTIDSTPTPSDTLARWKAAVRRYAPLLPDTWAQFRDAIMEFFEKGVRSFTYDMVHKQAGMARSTAAAHIKRFSFYGLLAKTTNFNAVALGEDGDQTGRRQAANVYELGWGFSVIIEDTDAADRCESELRTESESLVQTVSQKHKESAIAELELPPAVRPAWSPGLFGSPKPTSGGAARSVQQQLELLGHARPTGDERTTLLRQAQERALTKWQTRRTSGRPAPSYPAPSRPCAATKPHPMAHPGTSGLERELRRLYAELGWQLPDRG